MPNGEVASGRLLQAGDDDAQLFRPALASSVLMELTRRDLLAL